MSQPRILLWPESERRVEQLFTEAGITQVVSAPPPGALTGALWPGIAREPNVAGRGDETASASREPWVDANGFRVEYERALGKRNILLAPSPPSDAGRIVPFETVELSLTEARVHGGNAVLAPDGRYRQALRAGDPKALAAWKSMASAARWLDAHEHLFAHPVVPTVTMLVDEGEASAELANLAYRRGAMPRLVSAVNLPEPSPGILVLAAASLRQPPPAALWDHARAGATVVVDSPPDPSWRLLRKSEDRTFYSLGKGQVLAYHAPIEDPSEFALDLLDLVTHRRRAARLWNALATIPVATVPAGPGRSLLLHAINYGSPVDADVQARVQGHYANALLREPGMTDAVELKVSRRGLMSEVFLPHLHRLASIEFRDGPSV